MRIMPTSPKVAGTAMTTPHFLLLFAAMLVAASGNTAVQSVMPAIGRAMSMPDVVVAVAYTISAILWVWVAPYWARASDRHGRKRLILMGVAGFVVSTLLCGFALFAGLSGWVAGATAFILFGIARAIYGGFGSATPSATQAYLASKTRRTARVSALSSLSSSFGLGTVIGPALAPLFVVPLLGLPGPFFGFALIGLAVLLAIHRWLPDDTAPRHGRRAGHGAAMSYPSLATATTGASVVAATAPRGTVMMNWREPRIRRWIIAGIASGHAQASVLTFLGFFVIDRLGLEPMGSEGSISIVLMAGAGATLAAQWGLIPRLALTPKTLIVTGSLIAASGFGILILAHDLYALVLGFALASLGFGFTRPGFTGGASLAVSLAEQGAVAGVITSANGMAYLAAPTLTMLAYAIDPALPAWLSLAGLAVLAWWSHKALD